MAKYHINAKGEPGLCRATTRPCPLGGEDEHYPSREAAQSAYEAKMSSELPEGFGKVTDEIAQEMDSHYQTHPTLTVKAKKVNGRKVFTVTANGERAFSTSFPDAVKTAQTLAEMGRWQALPPRPADKGEVLRVLSNYYSKTPQELKMSLVLAESEIETKGGSDDYRDKQDVASAYQVRGHATTAQAMQRHDAEKALVNSSLPTDTPPF